MGFTIILYLILFRYKLVKERKMKKSIKDLTDIQGKRALVRVDIIVYK